MPKAVLIGTATSDSSSVIFTACSRRRARQGH